MRRILVFASLFVTAVASAQTFPADNKWFTVLRHDCTMPIFDAPLDTASGVGTGSRDIVSTNEGSVQAYSDGTNLYFRIRVDTDPREKGNGLTWDNFIWGCQISTDGDDRRFEWMAILNGKTGTNGQVEIWQNTGHIGLDDRPSDVSEGGVNMLASYTAPTTVGASVCGGGATGTARDCTDNSNDFYVDFAVPMTVMGLTVTSSIQVVCGDTSNSNAALTTGNSGDIAGLPSSGDPQWNTISSCAFQLGCGTFPCTTGVCSIDDNATCVECNTDPQCATDPDGHQCLNHVCVECDPANGDADCTDNPDGPYCIGTTCHECKVVDGLQQGCANPNKPICSGTNSCTDCTLAAVNECSGQYSGLPGCKAVEGGTQCVPCTTDSQCTVPPNNTCNTGTNVCEDCVPTQQDPNNGCAPDSATPHCGDNHMCGPCVDADCPGHCVTDTQSAEFGECVDCLTNDQCDQGVFASPTCLTNHGHVCGPCTMGPVTPPDTWNPGDADCQDDDPTFNACAQGTGLCVECTSDAYCNGTIGPASEFGNFCDLGTLRCGECTEDHSCDAGSTTPICDTSGQHNDCVPCDETTNTCDGMLHCVTEGGDSGACVDCIDSFDCLTAEFPICDATHVCRVCGEDLMQPPMVTDGDMECFDKDHTLPVCADSATAVEGQCVECNEATQAVQCPSSHPQCILNSCELCDATHDSACTGATPACQTQDEAATPGVCGECNDDADCSGKVGKTQCELVSGTCVECTEDANCSGTPSTPVCAPDHTCKPKCEMDSDCKDPDFPVCNGMLGHVCTECSGEDPIVPHQKLCTDNDEVCNVANGSCVPCLEDNDCPAPGQPGEQCDDSHNCVECTANPDCTTPADPYCNIDTENCTDDCSEDTVICPEDIPVCYTQEGPLHGQCHECGPLDDHLCTEQNEFCDVTIGDCFPCVISANCPIGECVNHVCVALPDAGVPDAPPLPPDAAPPVDAPVQPEPDAPVVNPPDAAPLPIDAPVAPIDAPPPPPIDAAPPVDGAVTPPVDGAVDAKPVDAKPLDAGATLDAKLATSDAAPITPTPEAGFLEGGGCACRVDAEGRTPAGSAFWALLGIVGIVVVRRRRRR